MIAGGSIGLRAFNFEGPELLLILDGPKLVLIVRSEGRKHPRFADIHKFTTSRAAGLSNTSDGEELQVPIHARRGERRFISGRRSLIRTGSRFQQTPKTF